MFDRVAIFGVGLIGGSFALALDRFNGARHIIGVGRSRATLDRAVQLGVIDDYTEDSVAAVRGADLVLIAAPVAQIEHILSVIQPAIGLRCVVTDAGSTKADVVAAARRALGGKFVQFVPAHPIAGKEQSGVEAAEATLFDGKRCILTPERETAGHCVERVREMWERCGALVTEMPAQRHDEVFAAVSHLPHILSFALVAAIAREEDAALKFAHAGGGFRDFTRIAASSPEMWRDICLSNREAILRELDGYEAELQRMRALLVAGDGTALAEEFEVSRQARSQLRF